MDTCTLLPHFGGLCECMAHVRHCVQSTLVPRVYLCTQTANKQPPNHHKQPDFVLGADVVAACTCAGGRPSRARRTPHVTAKGLNATTTSKSTAMSAYSKSLCRPAFWAMVGAVLKQQAISRARALVYQHCYLVTDCAQAARLLSSRISNIPAVQ